MNTYVCPVCKERKQESDFGRRGKYRVSSCKRCVYQRTLEWNKKNPEKLAEYQKRSKLKRNYKLTLEEYNELSKKGCMVCGSFESLCVDHDHACCPTETTCGECVRGILCGRHNKALGWVSDSVEELEGLISYLTSRT